MPLTPIKILERRLTTFRTTLQGASDRRKDGNVSLAIADEFNGVLEEVSALLPDFAGGLPKPAPTRGFGVEMGLVPINYLDLEMLVDQTLAMIELAGDAGHNPTTD